MVSAADQTDCASGRPAEEWTGRGGGGRLSSGAGNLDGRDGCRPATSAGDDPAFVTPSPAQWRGYRDGQSAGTGWGFKQFGHDPQPYLACLCLDHPSGVSAALVEGDRSADRVLPDQASGVESGRPETGWVQDPVGDPGVASAVESDRSAD